MPTFSNEIIIGGTPYEIGEGIQVINFRDNLDYSFFDPVGGECAAGAGGGGPAVPGLTVPGMTTPGATQGNSGGRRRYSWRPRLSERAMAGMEHGQVLQALGSALKHIVIHHDATYTAHHCFTVLCRRGLSTHFMVNHDGGIIQGLDPVYSAYHAGDFNGASIGVDMNNVATVEGHQTTYPDPAFGGVADYASRELVEGRVNSSRKTSFAYTEPQYVSLCALLRLLHDLVGFPLIFPQSDTGGVVTSRLTDPHNFIGFYGHWHCQAGKWDPGPGFDWERVLEGLHGKSHHWPLDLGTPTLRDLRSQDGVNEATRVFFESIEEGPGGGAYPIGLNQQWHNGVHIHAPRGTAVQAIAEGEIILTRNGPNLPLGSPNFVLMRHNIEREIINYDAQGVAEIATDVVQWFSLYMHLDRMYHTEVEEDEPEVPPTDVENEDDEDEDDEEELDDIVVEDDDEPTIPEGYEGNREVPDWYRRLVRLARDSKGLPLERTEDHTVNLVDANPRLFEETARGLLRIQEFRHAYQCIEDGNPFRWVTNAADPEEKGIEVPAGTLLGYVGDFGERTNRDAVRVDMHPMLHFEVFSTTPIFDDTRFDRLTWQRVQGDLTGNSLVSVPEIVLPISGATQEDIDAGGPRADLGDGRIVTPSEVQRFFESGGAAQRHIMRTIIAQHLSEWDITVDDSRTANIKVLWPWQTEEEFLRWRALHVGYKWLNDDTRDLVGMIEGPLPIYTYHPVYLLGWWALNYGRALQGQTFEGLNADEIQAAIEDELANDDDLAYQFEGLVPNENLINLEDVTQFRIRYDDLSGVDSGEWHPDTEFISPLDRR